MGGENTYDNFDNSSIVSRTTNDTVSVGKYSLRKRELLLGAIAVAALVGVLILAIVLAVRTSDSDSSSSSKASVSSQGMGGKKPVEYCETPACLQSALYQKPILNEGVDPCMDFYSFACGNYAKYHERSPLQDDVSAHNEIIDLNIQRLVYALQHPVQNKENSYERKLKDFMTSCDSHFDKMSQKGKPLIKKVIEPMGGWWVFDSSVLDKFDFQKSLEMVHIDFWRLAFFDVSIKVNSKDWNNHLVELDVGGIGLENIDMYGSTTTAVEIQFIYKDYMKNLAKMLCLDNGVPINDNNIQQFADDALEVESAIALIASHSPSLMDPHHKNNLLSLSELNGQMNGSLDFISYMKALFNENPGKFEADTKVSVSRFTYFEKLGVALSHYRQDDQDGDRKLHNYMMWRLIQTFSRDLSWEYIHASRELDYALYQRKDNSLGFVYCFRQAEAAFSDAMNALFISHFVKDAGKKEAEKILDSIKEVMLEKITTLPWMSKSNQDFAMDKIKTSLYKIGFPEWLTDKNYLNNEYAYIKVSPTDYFENILNINKLHRHTYNTYATKPSTRTEWAYHIFDPIVQYYNPWAELIATSAAMQNPLFSHNGPVYYNYGGVGSTLATNLVHAIDEYGSRYKEDGSSLEDWWTQITQQHYAKIRQCAVDSQNDVKFPTATIGGQLLALNPTRLSSRWAPQLLADSTGVRFSYLAYVKSGKNKEILPPGFSNYNADQMFFISYAQAYCQNTPKLLKFYQMYRGNYPGEFRVNLALKQVPEFHHAFGCKAVPDQSKQCLLFDSTN